MKASLFGFTAVVAAVVCAAAQQDQATPPQSGRGPTVSYQVQPSVMEQAESAMVLARPSLEPQITYTGPLVALARGENVFAGVPESTNIVYAPSLAPGLLEPRRPPGLVLFAISF